eukprot:8913083-Pyramimonas_sp.AAC.1
MNLQRIRARPCAFLRQPHVFNMLIASTERASRARRSKSFGRPCELVGRGARSLSNATSRAIRARRPRAHV